MEPRPRHPPLPPPLPYSLTPPDSISPSTLRPVLSPSELQQWATAQLAHQPIRSAITIATIDGWCTALFASLTLVCGVSTPSALLLGLGMAGVAFTSFRAVRRLRRLDPAAPRILALNQVALAAMIILYCLWNLYTYATGRSSLITSILAQDPALTQMLGSVEDLARQLSTVTYSAIIAATLLAQGFTALFYARRTRLLHAYLATTAPWIIQLQNA